MAAVIHILPSTTSHAFLSEVLPSTYYQPETWDACPATEGAESPRPCKRQQVCLCKSSTIAQLQGLTPFMLAVCFFKPISRLNPQNSRLSRHHKLRTQEAVWDPSNPLYLWSILATHNSNFSYLRKCKPLRTIIAFG